MPTRKIRDLSPEEYCRDVNHGPPGHAQFGPGVYEHVCPGCGKTTEFTVRREWYSVSEAPPSRLWGG